MYCLKEGVGYMDWVVWVLIRYWCIGFGILVSVISWEFDVGMILFGII